MEEDKELKRIMALYEPVIGKKPRLSSSFDEVYEKLVKGEKGIIVKLAGEPREIVLLALDPSTGNITYANPLENPSEKGGFTLTKDELKDIMDSGGIAF
ncbi:MAG: hypothetical protein J7M18_03065, partial [Candidatus Eremiobacteraeota bacterium]|nr:hypothetical protein [Candidatus Eremiobacteraeota bacterium]